MRLRGIAIAASGPGALVAGLAIVALLVGAAGDLLLEKGSAPGAQPGVNEVALWCLRGLAAAGLVALLGDQFRRRRGRRAGALPAEPDLPREPARRDLLSAAMIAVAVVLLALLLPIHYMAARTHPTTMWWNHFGFLDKRWLTSLFMIATAGSALALAVAARIVATALQSPPSWRGWMADVLPARGGEGESAGSGRRWPATTLKLLSAVAIAAYFFGPPWHLPAIPIDYHEAVTMGGVQAVRTGWLPYIDAAAVQYGPGAELANAAYVGAVGPVSVDGLREVTLIFHLLAATIFLGALFLRVRLIVAVVTALAAATIFPTLQTFIAGPGGSVDGYYWGWTDTLRYAGVFLVAMAFPALVARIGAAPGRVRSVALGAAWGLLCVVAQENLIGGALVLGILSVLFVVTATYGRRAILSVLGGIAAGFAVVAIPMLAFYAAHGRLGRFLELYTLVPRAVAAGYSNTPFEKPEYARLFHGLPLLLGVLLLAALLSGRPIRVATRWSRERVLVVSALLAAVICHLGALTRSDAPHLINTELALPAAVCLAAFYLPGLIGARSRASQWIGGLAIALTALALLPAAPWSQPKLVAVKLWRPLHARVDPPPVRPKPAGIPAHSVAAARVGNSTVRQEFCCTRHKVPMAKFVRFMDRLHATVGTRRVLVDEAPLITPPAVYFLADLRPAPFLQDYGTMAINGDIRDQWYRFLDSHLAQTQAVVTTSLSRFTPQTWLAAFPRHRTVTLRIAGERAYVLLR
ncbi:MAG: hypothetical protein QOH62_3035 [Solirubrobacteraceae bacterium]|nr:hypothetical protein [Solirubrobacteraceae bacterium]